MGETAGVKAALTTAPGAACNEGDPPAGGVPFILAQTLIGEDQTARLAERLAPLLRTGDVVALWGGLGAGKTVLARALIRARCASADEVPSPTFTLVQTYPPRPPCQGEIWHFDLYRLNDPEEAWELGIEDAFAGGISLIEWPDRLGPLLPPGRLDVRLARGDEPDTRLVRLEGDGNWCRRLKEAGLA